MFYSGQRLPAVPAGTFARFTEARTFRFPFRPGFGNAQGLRLLYPATNSVTIGSEADIFSLRLTAHDVNWISGDFPQEPLCVRAKIRYSAPDCPALMTPLPDGRIEIRFEAKQRAVTPGQSVVLYEGNCVLGGGIID